MPLPLAVPVGRVARSSRVPMPSTWAASASSCAARRPPGERWRGELLFPAAGMVPTLLPPLGPKRHQTQPRAWVKAKRGRCRLTRKATEVHPERCEFLVVTRPKVKNRSSKCCRAGSFHRGVRELPLSLLPVFPGAGSPQSPAQLRRAPGAAGGSSSLLALPAQLRFVSSNKNLKAKGGWGVPNPPMSPQHPAGALRPGAAAPRVPPQRRSRLFDVDFPFPSLFFFCLCLKQYVFRFQWGGRGLKTNVGRAQNVRFHCLKFSGSVLGYTVALESTFCS